MPQDARFLHGHLTPTLAMPHIGGMSSLAPHAPTAVHTAPQTLKKINQADCILHVQEDQSPTHTPSPASSHDPS